MADQDLLDDLLFVNGIDGETGDYAVPPMTCEDLSRRLRGDAQPENLAELRYKRRNWHASPVKEGVDPMVLGQAGWGVIFTHDADPAVREALQPLLDLREKQAGEYFKIYAGEDGYQSRESKPAFLARHKASAGPADPAKVPYYLLLVGSPETIPFRFQTRLDVQYAVGRIHFDTVEEYANYARSVVAAEEGRASRPRKVSFFGATHDDDRATRASAKRLLGTLIEHVSGRPGLEVESVMREEATKANLARLLGGRPSADLRDRGVE